MTPEETADRFAELFPAIYWRFYRRLAPDERRLTPESLAFLTHLASSGPLTVSEASRHFDRSQSATSELVDRLERRGLVGRMEDERDRRRILIWLSERGREELTRSRQVLSRALLLRAVSRLSEPQRRALIEATEALVRTPP